MSRTRLRCPCGEMLVGDDEHDLVARAQEHLVDQHPTLAGEYSPDEILFMAF